MLDFMTEEYLSGDVDSGGIFILRINLRVNQIVWKDEISNGMIN